MFPCSSSGIHCFPMNLVPLSFAMLPAPWPIHSSKRVWYYQSLEPHFDNFFNVASSGRKQTPQEKKAEPSGKCFQHEWHWTVRVICPSSYNSFFAHFMDDTTGFLAEYQRDLWFSYIFPNRFRVWAFPHFSTTSWILPIRSSSFKIKSCAIPSILRSTLNSGSFWSVDSSLRTSCMVREDALTEVSCCCCCCDCQALLCTIFGEGRGVESFSNKVRSPFWEIHFVNAICRHNIVYNYGMIPCLTES